MGKTEKTPAQQQQKNPTKRQQNNLTLTKKLVIFVHRVSQTLASHISCAVSKIRH